MNSRQVSVTRIFQENYDASPGKTILCNEGGARSSKSYSIAQLFVKKLSNPNTSRRMLITRKTLPSLKHTAMKTVINLLNDYGYYRFCKHNKTDRTIGLGNNWLLFSSIDQPSKIKSHEFNDIWLEEANEFTYDDFMNLQLRLSAPPFGDPNRIYLSYNPSLWCWIDEKVLTLPETMRIHSTYKDNPYLPAVYVQKLLSLKKTDPNYYKVYALGQHGDAEGIIFPPFEEYRANRFQYDETFYGLDFGYNNPTALLRVNMYDNVPYVQELMYRTKLTTTNIIECLDHYVKDKSDTIYADAAEPDRIEEIKMAGFNIKPAIKAVAPGISCVKSFYPIYVHCDSHNLKKERKSYMYKQDKDGNFLDEPVKFNDHLMDALRYAMYTHLKTRMQNDFGTYVADSQMSEQNFY